MKLDNLQMLAVSMGSRAEALNRRDVGLSLSNASAEFGYFAKRLDAEIQKLERPRWGYFFVAVLGSSLLVVPTGNWYWDLTFRVMGGVLVLSAAL